MNGDAQAIMNKIVEISTRQEERHVENKQDLKVIFKKLDKLDTLPCAVHKTRLDGFQRSLGYVFTFLITVVMGGIVLGIWVKSMMGG